jgi:hypothetical protein
MMNTLYNRSNTLLRTPPMQKLLAIPQIKAYLALLVVYVVWGTTLAGIQISVQTMPPL